MITENKLVKFFEAALDTLKTEEDGCMYKELEDGLFAVCAYVDDVDSGDNFGCVCAKIAYNCDALQCDYDYDWYFPTTADGELYVVEDILTGQNLEDTAHYFMNELEAMLAMKNSGEIDDWNE